MLGQRYKFHIVNNLGVDMDLDTNSPNEIIQLNLRPWKITSSGAVVYASEITQTFTANDVADGAFLSLAEINNSVDLNIGLHGELNLLTDDASADGSIDLFYEISTDGGTTFPSSAADFIPEQDLIPVASLRLNGDGTGYKRSTPFEI